MTNENLPGSKNHKISHFINFRGKKGWFVSIFFIILFFSFGYTLGINKGEVKIISMSSNGVDEAGVVNGKESSLPSYLSRDVEFRIFWDVWNTIQESYYGRPVPETQMFYGALNGMVSGLGDPFSAFLEPEVTEDITDELRGEFEGIGAEIGIRNDVLTVISPLSGSPAVSAGLRAQDVILKVDDKDTINMSLIEAVNNIRGPKGTTVTLSVFRPKTGESLEIEIRRDTIEIVSVELEFFDEIDFPDFYTTSDKSGKIAYLRVTNFHADTSARFARAVNEIILANPTGVILDLRSNPGGLLDTAINTTDYWVEKGDIIVSEKYNGGEEIDHFGEFEPILSAYNTVVLINGGSASGAEIMAGALQDHGLATLMGETTFGKGSVQRFIPLDDGSSLKLTTAHWLTPNHFEINEVGISPDIEVEMTEEDYNEDLDPQLDEAVKYVLGVVNTES